MRRPALLLALALCAPAQAATLTWTSPLVNQIGDTLSTRPLAYQIAYSTQSATWVAFRDSCLRDTALWARVVREAEPVPVASGHTLPGEHMSVPAPLVISFYWPFSLWVRTKQDSSGWSVWSNPVTRASN
jgi:hypothetical protein